MVVIEREHEVLSGIEQSSPELLFPEAKQRQRQRRLATGIVTLVVCVVLLGVFLGLLLTRGMAASVKAGLAPGGVLVASHRQGSLSLRPLLCYAPPFSPSAVSATSAPIPNCGVSYQLSAASLDDRRMVILSYPGWAVPAPNIPPDPQFAMLPTTKAKQDRSNTAELLSGSVFPGPNQRFVVGPAGITQSAVSSVESRHLNGLWIIDLTLTHQGSRQWDAFAKAQFHRTIAVELNGRIITDAVIEPLQPDFKSLQGHAQIAGPFTQQQARAIAAQL